MRFTCLVLSLALVGVATAAPAESSQGSSQLSSDEILEMQEILSEVLIDDDQDLEQMPRSIGTIVGNVFDRIPWNKIAASIESMAKKNPKFTKVLNLINDSKFRQLLKNSVDSHTLGEFVKDVSEHGFSWTEFLHLLLHALCSAANTLQHDRYTVSVCQVLQNV